MTIHDVASEASVAVFTAEVLRVHASVDVLINAAGRSYVRNLGTLRVTRAFLPMMKSDGRKKHIVNVASTSAADRGCHFPYAASQESFDRLSEALAENVRGTKIGLTTVIPSVRPKDDDSSAAVILVTDPAEVAAAVVAAVHSKANRPGKAILLTALLSPNPATSSLDDPRLRKGSC